ncbi:histidine kinase [Phytohabitans sp. ZYX-F-186]|uniref:histidine kinase n=1 Tax=Phytohabitans maris TaxID=3071409 RepID=A0ABU0ZKM7_9ACTN|nr:histidine kinase [Phytohabitans sp. ZYX-F-186]MDQ7907604.1 histidine kinase [Phytohabitans sp. ZYX-F-186]
MTVRTPPLVTVGRAAAWLVVPALVAGTLLLEHWIAATGFPYPRSFESASSGAYATATLVCWLVGVVLTWRVVGNVVGWLFLALAASITGGGLADAYGVLAVRADPGSLPSGELAAAVGDAAFAWGFLLIALCLQLTPSGRPMSPRWAVLVWASIGSCVVFEVAALLRSTPLGGANAGQVSPLAVPGLAGPAAAVAAAAVVTLGLCVLASVAAIVVRFRASRGTERQRMLWLVVGVAPLPVCVVVAFLAAYSGHEPLSGWAFVAGLTCLAVGVSFSIMKYRLYGVEEAVVKTLAYLTATGAVAAAYGLVVLAVTGTVPAVDSGSTPTTVLATLVAAAVALPAYRWARDAVDRRFNRRRFDAVRMIRAGLAAPSPDLVGLMRTALGDPDVRIVFPADNGGWVSPDGQTVTPASDAVDVTRMGATAAKVEFDPHRTDRVVVDAVARVAAAEIDNLGLRAALARQLHLVRESRARLANAHLDERRRMERDLHDGAQQRLLAIAFQLQSARINGTLHVLREQTSHAIEQLAIAVQELRDLANGLQPHSLASGGLRAAVEDLTLRIPLRLTTDVTEQRFAPTVESAAWFVIAEAVSNAAKYATTDAVHIAAAATPNGASATELRVTVTDHGAGGADPAGRGLQGLADRVAALGGRLTVTNCQPHGTRVEATLPCES